VVGTEARRWDALDGLRALAVAAVLLFHGGFSWASGGFLGVSTFFTLSGFLITSLLLHEHAGRGRVDVAEFWRRRVRRLVPAALAALAVVAAFGLTVATADQRRALFGDVVGAITCTINWRFIVAGQSYAHLFTAPSPLQHFWSLAVEGQFYVVFPILAAVALGRGRRFGRLAALVVTGMAGSLLLTLFAGYSHDRIFYGTDTRAFELLAGAALALGVDWRSMPAARHARARPQGEAKVLGIAGVAALIACGALWWRTSLGTEWLYRGGFAVYSLLSVTIIAAVVLAPSALVGRALAARPLRAVGLVSYGLYVFHWPVFLWLTPERLQVGEWPTFAVRLAVTSVLAIASWYLLENPIRTRRLHVARALLPTVAVATTSAVLLLALAVSADAPRPPNDFVVAARRLAHPPPARVVRRGVPTVGWFGDSTGVILAEGSTFDAGGTPRIVDVGGEAAYGCSVGQGGRWLLPSGSPGTPWPGCDHQLDAYQRFVDRQRPNLAVVLYGPNDLYDREVPGVCGTWCHVGTEPYDSWLRQGMLHIVDLLSRDGSLVVWLTTPPMPVPRARTAEFNEMVRQLPSERPGKVVVVDFCRYLEAKGHAAAIRPDGIHLSDRAAVEIGQGWFVGQLVDIWNTRRSQQHG
jgi:peptidoglycan/LPS O-acetylase OafA/YrhL